MQRKWLRNHRYIRHFVLFLRLKKKRWKEEGGKKKLTGEQATWAGVANAHERYESFSTPMYVRTCVYARLKIRSHWEGTVRHVSRGDRSPSLSPDRFSRSATGHAHWSEPTRHKLETASWWREKKRKRERKVSRDERGTSNPWIQEQFIEFQTGTIATNRDVTQKLNTPRWKERREKENEKRDKIRDKRDFISNR